MGKTNWLSMHLTNFGCQMTVHLSIHPASIHPSVCTTGKPIWNVTFSRWCGSLKHVFNLLLDIHIMVCLAGIGANSSRSLVIKLSAAQLLAFNWLQAQVYVFHQLVLKSQWPSPKVNYRFVDFFAVVPSSLSEVLYKCRNRSFPFRFAEIYTTGIHYLIFLNNDCQCIMASFSNLFYLFLMLLLQLMNMAQIIGVQLITNC